MLLSGPDRATAKARSTRAHTGSEHRHKGRTTESIHRFNRQRRTRSDTHSGKSLVRGPEEAIPQAKGYQGGLGDVLRADVERRIRVKFMLIPCPQFRNPAIARCGASKDTKEGW